MATCPTCSETYLTADEGEFTHCANPACSNSWICGSCAEKCEICDEAFCCDCVSTVEDPYEQEEDRWPRCCHACAETVEFIPRIPVQPEVTRRIAAKAQVA